MADFRSFKHHKRLPAKAMEPVVDPAGWTAETLGAVEDFSYSMTEQDIDDLVAGIAAFRRHNIALEEVAVENFPLNGFADVLADVRRELIDGRGIVMLRNSRWRGSIVNSRRSVIWVSVRISASLCHRTSTAISWAMSKIWAATTRMPTHAAT